MTDKELSGEPPTPRGLEKAILIGHRVVECNLMTWARWFEAASHLNERHVGNDDVGGMRVSTVFLGMNHQWGNGPKLWFETMVFGGPLHEMTQRYTTWEQAEAGHKFILAIAKGEAAVVRDKVKAELQRIAAAASTEGDAAP